MPKYILNGATGDLDVVSGTENDPPTLGEKILNKGFKDKNKIWMIIKNHYVLTLMELSLNQIFYTKVQLHL